MLIIRVDYDADPRLVDKSALAEHKQWVEILSEQKSCPPTAQEDYRICLLKIIDQSLKLYNLCKVMEEPKHIYNPITAMSFSAMFTS